MQSIVKISVFQLLGEFNHSFEFPSGDEFIILHGPNGVGKTRLLELIKSIFSYDFIKAAEIPFESIKIDFEDGSSLAVRRVEQLTLPNMATDSEGQTIASLTLIAQDPSGEKYHYDVDSSDFEKWLSREAMKRLPVEQIGRGQWHDLEESDFIDLSTLLSRYPETTKNYITRSRKFPEPIRKVIDSTKIYLIETQRLLQSKIRADSYSRFSRSAYPRPRNVETETVVEFSKDFSRRFREALAENSQTSQKLDRDFPRRLINLGRTQDGKTERTEEEIRERYIEQGRLRTKLAEISLLDNIGEIPLPTGSSLNEWEKLVLWAYLEDTEKKLSTFKPLLDRVDLLREIVNSRFLNKKLELSIEKGFYFVTNKGMEIPPSKLSSGEQHELVLAYELLFRTAEGSIVLIDEPEISLHVAWQQEFLNDIIRISHLTSLRFIVATHSPQVVHRWWSRTRELNS